MTCVVPESGVPGDVTVGVSANGDGEHYVPVVTHQRYTYYTPPTASFIGPPGGPVLGSTTLTIHGVGFDGLNRVATAACSFPNVPVATVSLSADGTQMVCNTTAAFAASRMLSVTLNGQDFDEVGEFRYYERPAIANMAPTGGPALDGYELTLLGTGMQIQEYGISDAGTQMHKCRNMCKTI